MTSPKLRPLLNNQFAPVTFTFDFIETSFLSLCDAFENGLRTLIRNIRCKQFTLLVAPLSTALRSLEPLTNPIDRYLLVETSCSWTAVFANGLRVNDVSSPTGYLPTVLGCRGLEVRHSPDFSKSERKDLMRMWGSATFALYGPTKTDCLNRIRLERC